MEKYTSLLARIFLSAIFIKSGIDKILNPSVIQQFMESKGIPFPGLLLIPTIIVLLIGGLLILLGYKARLGALLLIGFLIPTTLIFHTNFPGEMNAFMKNIGLMGGLMMVVAFGSGDLSLDNKSVFSSSNSNENN